MRLSLDIDTGAGNHPVIAYIGDVRPNFLTLWSVIGFELTNYSDQLADRAVRDLDNFIEFMHDQPGNFSGFPEPIKRDYPAALEMLTKFRNECRLHPACQINISLPVQSQPNYLAA